MKKALLLAVLGALALAGRADAATYTTATGSYGPAPQDTFETFVPRSRVPRAGILYVHPAGAGMTWWSQQAALSAGDGAVSMMVDFWGASTYPSAVDELAAAVTYLRNHWQVSPGRIAVVGASRGALLASELAFGPHSVGPVAFVGWSGTYDLPALSASTAIQGYLGCQYRACPDKWTAASAARQRPRTRVAVHLAHGTRESEPAEFAQATALDGWARSMGLWHELDAYQCDCHLGYEPAESPKTEHFLRGALRY